MSSDRLDDVEIVLDGVPGFRDLGGGLTRDGRRVRLGMVFRSEAPVGLTERDRATLAGLGLRLVCDLRSPVERDGAVVAWPPPSPAVLETEVLSELMVPGRFGEMLAEPTGHAARSYMLDFYRSLPRALGPALAQLFERIADDREIPVLIHCHAGKDRTGFICSLLLLALGATRAALEKEYALTAQFWSLERLTPMVTALPGEGGPTPTPDVVAAFGVHLEYLDAALELVEQQYGSVDGYLERHGAGPERRERLRDLLLEP